MKTKFLIQILTIAKGFCFFFRNYLDFTTMLFWYHFPIHCFYVFGLSFKRMIRTHAFIIFFCCYFLIKTNATSYFVFEVQTHDTVFYNVSLLLLISYIILKVHYCRFANLLTYSSWKKRNTSNVSHRNKFLKHTLFW